MSSYKKKYDTKRSDSIEKKKDEFGYSKEQLDFIKYWEIIANSKMRSEILTENRISIEEILSDINSIILFELNKTCIDAPYRIKWIDCDGYLKLEIYTV